VKAGPKCSEEKSSTARTSIGKWKRRYIDHVIILLELGAVYIDLWIICCTAD
jgi:hypothetical protein